MHRTPEASISHWQGKEAHRHRHTALISAGKYPAARYSNTGEEQECGSNEPKRGANWSCSLDFQGMRKNWTNTRVCAFEKCTQMTNNSLGFGFGWQIFAVNKSSCCAAGNGLLWTTLVLKRKNSYWYDSHTSWTSWSFHLQYKVSAARQQGQLPFPHVSCSCFFPIEIYSQQPDWQLWENQRPWVQLHGKAVENMSPITGPSLQK